MKTQESLVVLLTLSLLHRWLLASRHISPLVRLLTTVGETVDLDTAAVGRRDGSFIVWVRGILIGTSPSFEPSTVWNKLKSTVEVYVNVAECFRLEETAAPSGRQHDVEHRTAGQHGRKVARVFQG